MFLCVQTDHETPNQCLIQKSNLSAQSIELHLFCINPLKYRMELCLL